MKLYHYYIILGLLVITSSCRKDFLNVPDNSIILRQFYVTDLKTTNDFLNGIYIKLGRDFYHGNFQIYPDLIADNVKTRTASSSRLGLAYNWKLTANADFGGDNLNAIWLSGYQMIRSCSFVLSKTDEYRNENPVLADQMKAQALAIRAMIHFVLVNVFAQPYGFTENAGHPGVPYITIEDPTIPVLSRGTVADDYRSMVADLKLAIPLFGAGPTNKFFMNRNAAKALLARIYLFSGDYRSAKNIAHEFAFLVPLMPAGSNGYPSKLFTSEESEAIFQLMPSWPNVSLPSPTGAYIGTYQTQFQGAFFTTSQLFAATADAANAITQNPSDLRKIWVTLNAGTWKITKYPINLISGFSSSLQGGAYYNTLFRSSEMFLTAAEAYAQLNNADSARYFLNQIRTRANISAVGATLNGTSLLDSIYLERRRELAFEGLRMFDLLRWKKAVNRIDAWSESIKMLPYPSNKAIAPIPLNDVNIYGLKQNDGY